MRSIVSAAACLIAAAVLAAPAAAERSTDADAGVPPSCAERPNALGISRVVEVDTSIPTRFGNMQYKDIDFLNPGEVVLTFDDGPLRKYSLEVLNALEAHCTKATFFMVGRMAVNDPALVQEIDRRGHTVGTHTWSHRNLGSLNAESAEKEVELGVSAVSAALGKPVAPFFRFPYLSAPGSVTDHLHKRHVGVFSIDVDSIDYRAKSGDTVVDRILKGLKRQGKGILLFHDIQRSTAGGISELLDRLKAEGYKVVHIVPKAPIKTLPEYDELAAKELARSAKSAAARPLAKRSIVWPISNGQDVPAEPLVIKPLRSHKTSTSETDEVAGATVPKVRPTTAPSSEAAPAAERQTSQNEGAESESDWAERIFAN